jgi:hypothetical protein
MAYSGDYHCLVVREPSLQSSSRQMGERDARAIRSKEVGNPHSLRAIRQSLLRPLLNWGNG